MATYPIIKLSVLRDIGWELWDPIGLGEGDGIWPENCEDEYDSYLMKAVGMLCRSDSPDDVAKYLVQIATDRMGLTVVDTRAAHATAKALAEYLKTLPDGPKNIR